MPVHRFPVEATHTMMFARSIGDLNEAYLDPGSGPGREHGGVIAPPTFIGAAMQFDPDNPLRPVPGKPWFGSGRQPSGAVREGGGALHAEQHFEYHRTLRAGDVLTATHLEGATWDKQSARAGILHFSEAVTEYRHASSGELVVTARTVTVKTQRAPERG